jgi:hypothetical protein
MRSTKKLSLGFGMPSNYGKAHVDNVLPAFDVLNSGISLVLWNRRVGFVNQRRRSLCTKLGKQSGSVIQFGAGIESRSKVDSAVRGFNNPCMPRPEAAHRVKSYSAATGFVYQYYFYEVEKAKRGSAAGTEYVYMTSVDRKHVFPVKIFVVKDALEKWTARTGRQFTGTEEYAVAKMRLFQAFDEVEGLASAKNPDLLVDESNLDALLSQLDL